MYRDYELLLSDKQAITVSTNSTNYIDTLDSGWGHNDEVYARFMVGTAFAGTAASSVTLAIQIAQDTSFASVTTVVSKVILASTLTASKVPLMVKLPAEMATGTLGNQNVIGAGTGMTLPYRYIRAYYTVAVSGSLTAGTITCEMVMNGATTLDKVM